MSLSAMGNRRTLGRKRPEEECRKISLAMMGNQHNLGHRHTEETRRKMSLSAMGKQRALGYKHTEEALRKLRGRKRREEEKLRYLGANNPNWKGGKTPLWSAIRTGFRYRQWRCDVFTRDDYTCVWCGTRGGNIHADHIVPFATIMQRNNIATVEQATLCEELWNINNGRTLCKSCHKKRHQKKAA